MVLLLPPVPVLAAALGPHHLLPDRHLEQGRRILLERQQPDLDPVSVPGLCWVPAVCDASPDILSVLGLRQHDQLGGDAVDAHYLPEGVASQVRLALQQGSPGKPQVIFLL